MIANYKSNYILFSRNTYLTVTDYYLYRHAYSLSQMESDSIKVGTNEEKVSWQKVKWIQILKSEPESIFFNYNFNCENFIQVNG
jgi:hypothetical protein